MPEALTPGFRLVAAPLLGVRVDGRLVTYYLVLGVSLLLFLAMLRVVSSPFGRVLQAVRENEFRAEALGYRIRRLFVGVFVAGSALAGVGGVMWALYQAQVTPAIGSEMTILIFIILIIGGLGSVGGCFTAAVLVGLVTNYVSFLEPKLALGSNVVLMMLVLLWRPRGLFPVGPG